ncbi:response regulator, partial [Patescibacteria group bacterium]|nr:response regulator [Patescibacteria group bacterium]
IDDDEFIQILFKDIFWVHGAHKDYDVQIAPDLAAAKKIIENPETCPCLIFLDLMLIKSKEKFSLEGNESIKFLKELKSDKKTKDIIVVIFSGYGDKEIVKRALASGADDFLVKGEFMPQDLIKITDMILRKKKE